MPVILSNCARTEAASYFPSSCDSSQRDSASLCKFTLKSRLDGPGVALVARSRASSHTRPFAPLNSEGIEPRLTATRPKRSVQMLSGNDRSGLVTGRPLIGEACRISAFSPPGRLERDLCGRSTHILPKSVARSSCAPYPCKISEPID